MILTIKGADFSSANIGTLSTFVVSKSIGRGASFDIPSFVEKNSSVNWVITLGEDYTFGTYSVTMGGEVVTPTVNGSEMTIAIANVTGNIRITVATVYNGVEELPEPDEPDVPTPDEPETPGENVTDLGTLIEGKTFNTNATQNYNGVTKTDAAYFCYDKMPVEPNTTYRIQYGRATYLLTSDYSTIGWNGSKRVNLTSEVDDFTFTTPNGCEYISVTFKYEDIQPNEVVVQRLGSVSIIKESENYISELTSELLPNTGLNSTSYQTEVNEGTFVYKNIPIEANTIYQIQYARNTWFLDANKSAKYKVNMRTETTDYTHTTQEGIAYMTTSFSYSDIQPEDVKIIKYKKVYN